MEYFEITETELWAYFSETADSLTVQKVEKWKTSANFDEELFIKTKAIYDLTLASKSSVVVAEKNFFESIASKDKPKTFSWKNTLKYAAIFVALISGTYMFQKITSNKNQLVVQTTFGEQKEIKLSDGSIVWLNASSKLSYYKEFPRTLYLEGEAFFDVAKDSIHPFTVSTFDAIKVRALGTSFNVKSYRNSTSTETKLITGKVEVTNSKATKDKIILLPYEKAIFSRIKKEIIKSKIHENNKIISWKEGKIQFKNKVFKHIALDLKNQLNISLNFSNQQIANSKFTGSFSNNTPISEILEILKLSKNFNYELNTETNEWMIK